MHVVADKEKWPKHSLLSNHHRAEYASRLMRLRQPDEAVRRKDLCAIFWEQTYSLDLAKRVPDVLQQLQIGGGQTG